MKGTFGQFKFCLIAIVLMMVAACQTTEYQEPVVPSTKNNITAVNPTTYGTAYKKFYARAQQGDPIAQNNLGRMYSDGRGVEQNGQEAVKWFTKAAVQGNTKAMINLGMACLHGRGTSENKKQACKYFWKANTLGNSEGKQFYDSYCHA